MENELNATLNENRRDQEISHSKPAAYKQNSDNPCNDFPKSGENKVKW